MLTTICRDLTHSISNDKIFALDRSLFGPRGRRTGLDELRRFERELRILFDSFQRDLIRSVRLDLEVMATIAYHGLLQADESSNLDRTVSNLLYS